MTSSSNNEKASEVSRTECASDEMTATTSDLEHKKFFFGAQGRALRNHISIAGALGFLLFGYDQGVLGVRFATTARQLFAHSSHRVSMRRMTSSTSSITHLLAF
jgi:hypothetical protein